PFTGLGFVGQLFFQSMWSTCFYGMQSPALGLLDLLIVALIATMLWFTYRGMDQIAGWLWSAYLLWLYYLTSVNLAIWWSND
ncbi:MAG: tryptophan-rich sensory protein, partial [Acidobacteria bacterium]|nr:tryptophan-rich sensory protein [Acidobacteriota bacterium]